MPPTLRTRTLFQICIGIALLLSGCATGGDTIGSPSPLRGTQSAQVKAAAISAAGPTSDVPPREDMMDPIVLKDALTNIDALEKTFDWKPFRDGVDIARIYNTPNDGPAAAFLRYQPGASVPLHMHGGYEHIFILRGSQVDRSGEHAAGSVIINPPGSSHTVSSPNGCIVLIIWDKPVILAK